ncbi:MAG: ABC transporter permease [Phycisphaerae bacterium]
MNFTTLVAEALNSLRKNLIRTALSALGIVIGVASVIAMVAVGEGARQRVEAEIERLGDDWLMVGFWGIQRGGLRGESGMMPNEAEDHAIAIQRECSAVRAATPSNRVGVQVVSAFGNYQTSCQGVYANYFDIRRWDVAEGRLFTQKDSEMRNRVACIGTTAAKELFGGVSPLGQTIRVNKIAFEVVGVLASKGVGSDGRDNDDVIVFPWHSFQRFVAGNEVAQSLFVAARPGVPLAAAKSQIRALLRQRNRLPEAADDDFRIIDRTLGAQANAEATRTFNILLTVIASISLLVGGIGIMNIMLVSVTERTREIGLRMAIGANGYHVLGQFLTEAVVLCALGGLLGFLGGWAASWFVTQVYGWEAIISPWMAGVAIAFATGVGVFFGFYPAWRASRLDPIEALRFE